MLRPTLSLNLALPGGGAHGAFTWGVLDALLWSHYVAPVHVNPLGLDPLRDLVEAQLDFARLRRHAPFRLFVAATHANPVACACSATRS